MFLKERRLILSVITEMCSFVNYMSVLKGVDLDDNLHNLLCVSIVVSSPKTPAPIAE